MSRKPSRPTSEQLSGMSAEEKRVLLATLLASENRDDHAAASNPEPSELADAETEYHEDSSTSSSRSNEPAGAKRFPLSPAQERLWFLDQLQPGMTAYIIPAAIRLEGTIRPSLLRQCLHEIIERHEILRTRFGDVNGSPYQIIDPACDSLSLEVSELSNDAVRDFYAQPFNLNTGPLIRACLFCDLPKTDNIDHDTIQTDESRKVYLHFAIHHIVADYWSLRVLLQELQQRLAAKIAGKSPELPNLTIQYVDYAVWHREQLAKPDASMKYWSDELADAPSLLELPTDFARPAVQSHAGARVPIRLPDELKQKLVELARAEGVSLYSLLLTAVQSVLYRYTGQHDICVGSTVTNRDRPETQNLIGLFVNNLVFRAQIEGEDRFRDLVNQTHLKVINGLKNQHVPFEQMVETLKVERQMAHNPLFQVTFLLRPEQTRTESVAADVEFIPVDAEYVSSRFDLSIDLVETADGFSGFIEFRTDLFRSHTIERLVQHLETFLNAVSLQPNTPVGKIPLLTDTEQDRLRQWNQTTTEISDEPVHRNFEQQVTRTPDATALTFESESWSYSQLNEKANQLANFLIKKGCNANDTIAICLQRKPQLITAMLAVLKLGAHYVPLDPSYPASRIRFVLEDSRAKLVLLDEQLWSDTQPDENLLTVHLPEHTEEIEQQDRENLATNLPHDPLSLVYLIYTSGSTGNPKGVPIQHRSLMNLLLSMSVQPGIGPDDRLLAITTVAFDIAALEVFLPLTVGAQLVLANESAVSEGESLIQLIKKHRINFMQGTPETWRILLDALDSNRRKLSQSATTLTSTDQADTPMAGLKVLCGGEALDPELADRLLAENVELWNMYGPTETTIWSGALQITQEHLSLGLVPIGSPIANTKFHVLDPSGQVLPIGVPGELHISGHGLSPGYHCRPTLTDEKFISPRSVERKGPENPESNRLYATGDRARWLADGNLEFLGRIDYQVKLRGYRIELGDIESQLMDHTAVDVAVVILVKPNTANACLVAFCRLIDFENHDLEALTVELRNHLGNRLPSHMIPPRIVPLAELPRTPNGKIDRNQLPDLDAKYARLSDSQSRSTLAQMSEAESSVAKIWSELLEQPIEHHDANFFDRGGHSLLAARMIARVREEFSIEIPLRAIFNQPDLSSFAAYVEQFESPSVSLNDRTQTHLRHASTNTDGIPLTHAQQRQWVLAQLDPSNPAYNIPVAVNVDGPLPLADLEKAFEVLCARHEVLHTRYVVSDEGKPCGKIDLHQTVNVRLIDLSEEPPEAQESKLRDLLADEARKPFDLGRSPLLRVLCVQLSQTKHVILLVLHHMVGDAWSLRILLRELFALLKQRAISDRFPFDNLTLQYSDYAEAELHRENQLSREYWRKQLADAPSRIDLPIDYAVREDPSHAAGEVRFELDEQLNSSLKQISHRHKATLYMTLLAAFKVLLARFSNSEDIVVGSPVGHRPDVKFENVVGLFVNTLAFRTKINRLKDFGSVLNEVRQTVLDGLDHQDAPLDQVINDLGTDRNWNHSPVFQVMFLWQHEDKVEIQRTETDVDHRQSINISPHPLPVTATRCDVTLSMSEQDGKLVGRFDFREDLFQKKTIQSMTAAFQELIRSVAKDESIAVGKILLCEQSPATAADTLYPTPLSGDCLPDLFAIQAAKTPDAVAVTSQQHQMTYGDLNLAAEKLAYRLRQLGVVPETRVGVCLERTPDLIVALLGIMKAGGAYVPIDPSYPKSRIDFMLDDAAAEIVVSAIRYNDLLDSDRIRIRVREPSDDQIQLAGGAQLPPNCPTNAAYIIYTSGSTGTPKGVTIEHRSVIELLRWTRKHYSNERLRCVLASTSVCFDLSVFEIFVPLTTGGSIFLVENAIELSSIKNHDITLVNTVPSAAAELVRTQGIPPSVRTINVAGEPLSKQLVRDLYSAMDNAQKSNQDSDDSFTEDSVESATPAVFNLYGPSEDTTYSTVALMDPNETGQTSPIGVPVDGTQAYVLDEHLDLLPTGMVGELYLAGRGLARGYWQRPSLTAECFIPNPFSTDGQPLYRTGDRVRIRHDGQLEFLGRTDKQIKLRGFRIELGEIEQAILQNEEISNVAVEIFDQPNQVKSGSSAGKQIVAYLQQRIPSSTVETLSADSQFADGIRRRLAQRLPSYMLPSVLIDMPELPKLPNGKIDRSSLPKPQFEPATAVTHPPTNELETALQAIWQDLLNHDNIGVHDNFFSIGGDSIVALQMIARARLQGIQFQPRELFENPTIAGIASHAGQMNTESIEIHDPGSEVGEAPLAPIQNWFFELSLNHPEHWNQAILLQVNEPLQEDLLSESINELSTQHPALRATFNRANDQWRQTITPPGSTPPLTVVRHDTNDADEVIERIGTQVQSSFKLDTGPLWHIVYFDLTVDNRPVRRLLVACHHLIIDGVSWRILLADLQLTYRQLQRTGKTQHVPPTTFASNWVRHLKSSQDLLEDNLYWDDIDKQVAKLSLPIEQPNGDNLMGNSRSQSLRLSEKSTTQLLKSVPENYAIRSEELIIAALVQVLATWSEEGAVALQLERHGRLDRGPRFDLTRTVGWLTSLFPVVIPADHKLETTEFLKDVKDALRTVPLDGVGYGIAERDHCHQKVPDFRFNYLGQADGSFGADSMFSLASESPGRARHPDDARDVLHEVNAVVTRGELQIHWIYPDNMYTRDTMHRLASQFRKNLLSLIDFCLNSESDDGYSESDFPQMNFQPGELDDLMRGLE